MLKRKTILIIVSGVIVIAAAAVVAILLLAGGRSEPVPERVVIDLSALSDESRGIITGVMEEFSGLHALMSAVEPAGQERADIYFSNERPIETNIIVRPWRSFGWRLYSRLPTLANLEGEWKRQLILPLTYGEVNQTDFNAILERGLAEGLVPIAMVTNKLAESAFAIYSHRLDFDYTPFTGTYPTITHALSALERREIMFLFWDDDLMPLISQQVRPQHRGFIFPGSRDDENAFFVGSATWIVLAGGTTETATSDRTGPQEFVKYLTSPGVARLLQRRYTGEFFSWAPQAVDEELPEVNGPGEVIPIH